MQEPESNSDIPNSDAGGLRLQQRPVSLTLITTDDTTDNPKGDTNTAGAISA